MSFKVLCDKLESKIIKAYTEGVTMDEAEKLAGEFLHGMIQASNELQKADLNARMRKTGLKAIQGAIYKDEATKSDKKPTEAMLTALINQNEIVQSEQKDFDEAEVNRDALERYYNIFREGHIFTRGIAKGSFNG